MRKKKSSKKAAKKSLLENSEDLTLYESLPADSLDYMEEEKDSWDIDESNITSRVRLF